MDALSNRLYRLWTNIGKSEKAAFFSAFVIGFLAHVTFMTNRFFNHDSILYTLVDPGSTFSLEQGKWFSLPMQRLVQGDITSPGIILPAALILLGLTAALTVSTLKVKSPLWAAGTGGFLVLFPSVMCANIYDASALFFSALLLSALAVFVSVRWKFGFLGGIALLTISCGVYSVFIGYAAGLFILVLLFELLGGDMSVKEALQKGFKYLSVLLISAALYYVILELALRLNGVSLMDYRGIDQIGKFSVSSIGKLVYEAYRKVYYFFFYGIFLYRGHFEIEPFFRYLNWAAVAFTVILCGWMAVRRRIFHSLGRLALILALVVLFPLAIHVIAVLGQNAYTHWIMCYPFVLVYVALLAAADQTEALPLADAQKHSFRKTEKAFRRTATVLVLIVAVLLCRQWFFTTNQAYEYIRYQDENTISRGIMLTNDIQNAPDYSESVPVAFVGSAAPQAFQYTTGDFLSIHGQDGGGYTGYRNAVIDNERLKVLLRNWVGISFPYADAAAVSQLSANPEVAAMPVYPVRGSIALIDGVLVVKLSEIQTTPQE